MKYAGDRRPGTRSPTSETPKRQSKPPIILRIYVDVPAAAKVWTVVVTDDRDDPLFETRYVEDALRYCHSREAEMIDIISTNYQVRGVLAPRMPEVSGKMPIDTDKPF